MGTVKRSNIKTNTLPKQKRNAEVNTAQEVISMKKKRYKSKTIRVLYAILKFFFDLFCIPFKIIIGILDIAEAMKE